MKALLLIDLQNDFISKGALEVPEGEKIIPIVNKIMDRHFDIIIASKDWHPNNHQSFASTHQKNVGDIIELNGFQQVLWPDHCIQNSYGAQFVPGLNLEKIHRVIFKGIDPNIDSYSAFFDNHQLKQTELDSYLKKNNVIKIFILGLATDYCVKYSVLDALALGYEVHIVEDACRGVNIHPKDSEKAFLEMSEAGAHIVSSKYIL